MDQLAEDNFADFSLLLLQNYILYLAIGVAVQFFNNLMASREAQKQYPFIKMERKITKEEEKAIFENMRSVFCTRSVPRSLQPRIIS